MRCRWGLPNALALVVLSGQTPSLMDSDFEPKPCLSVPVRHVAGWQRSGRADRQAGGRHRDRCSEGCLSVAGRASAQARAVRVEVGDRGGFCAATPEAHSARRQPELFEAAEYPVRQLVSDDRDDVDVG